MSKVNVALMGCGGFQGAHAQRLSANADAVVVALCDVDAEHANRMLGHHLSQQDPAPAVFTDPAEMYAQTGPDAVFIATPHTLHFEHAMAALDAGCHVYIEKPMVTSADHAYTLADKVRQTGKIVVVGYNTPCAPEFDYLRNAIRNKTLGKLEMVVGHLSQDWVVPTTGTWRQDPSLSGGGQAYDSGAHILNSLVWSVEDDVAEVHAFIDQMGLSVDVNSSINIRFKGGTMASIVISGNCPTSGAHMAFIFDAGKIEIDAWIGEWINVFDAKGRVKYPPITGKKQWPDDNFIDAVLGRAEPRTSVANGIVQSELMDAIYESARTGQPARPKQSQG